MFNVKLREICDVQGRNIVGLTHNDKPVDGGKMLYAISGCESNYGRLREFVRMEKGYAPGGTYFKADHVKDAWNRWGCLAASSYGSFQIMFIVALELGYSMHPIELQNDRIGAFWATKLITDRFMGRLKAKTLSDVLDCYNSGYHKDQFLPSLYIEKGIKLYNEL